jgi:hypothetical protein
MAMRRPFSREQRQTIVYGMLAFVLILVILQLWLLTATMNANLGGDESIVWPAAIASLACFALISGCFAISRVGALAGLGAWDLGPGLGQFFDLVRW